uniref:Aldo_ket_red domain-containing protein n=1 Tax=Caenorhabditis japonica TaxID=281687 RepID=A0A8R1I1Z2_CAEJA
MFQLKNGEELPKLALGTYLTDGEPLFNAVDQALKDGYRHFDTAKYYENEEDLGNAFKTLLPRHNLSTEQLYITTKIFPYASPDAGEKITADVEESLKWFGRSYLDLVLVHYPRPLETGDKDKRNKIYRKEAWLTLEKLKNSGKIRSIGVSNYEICHIEEMREYQTIQPQVNQCEYHPHFQRKPLKDYCQENGILFQAFSPLGRQNKQLLEDQTLARIAAEHHASVAAIILAWIMHGKVAVVAKSVTAARISENFGALKLNISEKEFEEINELDRQQPYVEDNGWECV